MLEERERGWDEEDTKGSGGEVSKWRDGSPYPREVQVVMNWKTFTGVDAAEKLWFDRGKRKKPFRQSGRNKTLTCCLEK